MPPSIDSKQNDEPQELWSSSVPGTGSSLLARVAPVGVILMMILLLGIGLSMISSATITNPKSNCFQMQIKWIIIGGISCLAGALFKLNFLYRKSHWGLLLIFFPLAYLTTAAIATKFFGAGSLRFFPFAASIKGAVRWFRFGTTQIQPSEFAKVFLVLFLAAYYGRLPRAKIKEFVSGLLIPILASGALLMLVLLGKDLSSTFVTGVMAVGVMFMAGVKLRYMVILLLLGSVLCVGFIAASPMRRDRIVAWQHPEEAKDSESYQLFRSQICLGIGSLTGKGYSKGYLKTYLPEAHTDFIIAVIGEELGFVGIMFLVLCYLGLCICIMAVAKQCRMREDMLLCNGIALLISVQAFVNLGVVSGMIPPTGVTAPFLSYGGSSLISLMFLIGLVLNVSRRNIQAIWDEIGTQRCLPTMQERTQMPFFQRQQSDEHEISNDNKGDAHNE